MKKLVGTALALSLVFTNVSPVLVKAETVNLYDVFSNKNDKFKNEVGSQVYKWSMYLPDDAQIFKSDRANYFNMYTNSYQSNINIEVNKNKYNFTLEDILLRLQNNNMDFGMYMFFGPSKEYTMDIITDENGKQCIQIIKNNPIYDYFLVDDAAEEYGDFIENRIYVENGYVYNFNVTMNGRFYREHKEMFNKLVSSFKTSFDSKNPNIKELTDASSQERTFINKTYGYSIVMQPYWKTDNMSFRNQVFKPIYDLDELQEKNIEEGLENVKIQDGIQVSVVSSARKGETVDSWVKNELETFKKNYNSKIYEILSDKKVKINGVDAYIFEVRFNTITSKPYVSKNVYLIGNGYKYKITATISNERYNDALKRQEYDKMINSFKLDSKYLSKNLGRIIDAKELVNLNQNRELKLKKYDFKINVPKSFANPSEMYSQDYYYDIYYKYDIGMGFGGGNYEDLNVSDMISKIRLNVFASIEAQEMKDLMKSRLEVYNYDTEVIMGLAKIDIKSIQYQDAEIYRIEKSYDIDKINEFVKENQGKVYDLNMISNEYNYIIKLGNDLYSINLALPVANITDTNKNKIESIINSITIKGKNYGNINSGWKQRDLKEFKNDKQDNLEIKK